MRENCLVQFEAHWNCLEMNNQEYYACRKPERSLNKCMFEKLVCLCLSLLFGNPSPAATALLTFVGGWMSNVLAC